VAAVKFRAV